MTRSQSGEVFRLIVASIAAEIRGFICRWFRSTCPHRIGDAR